MPIDLTTVSGTLYDVLGQPKAGITVWIVSAVKSGLAIYDQQVEAAVSDSNGAVSFTVPRASTVWLSGTFFVGATDFTVSTGISLVIPDSATATLESLGAAYSVPVQGLTIKSNGSALANLCGTVDFSSDFTVTESPTGEANVGLSGSLIVTTEQVQDALTTFFPDSGPYDWTYNDAGNAVGLVIASATTSVNGLMSAADKTLFDAIPATYAPIVHTHLAAQITDFAAAVLLVSPLDSPAFTGIPTAPTAAQGTNTTQISTTAFVRAEIAALVGSVPSTLDTLDELAQALGDDPNFATTMTTALGLKANTSSLAAVALSGSATDLITGTLADGRLSANVPLLNAANIFSVNNAAALAIGPNGNTNPVVRIVTNVASQADGISISGGAAGAGTTIAALSSGSNSDIIFAPKGTGRVIFPNGTSTNPSIKFGDNVGFYEINSSQVGLAAAGNIAVSLGGGSVWVRSDTAQYLWGASGDVRLIRRAAANLNLGDVDAASPVAQTLSVQSVVAGTSNVAGANWILKGSAGTGTGAGGSIDFSVAPAGSTGSTQNAFVTPWRITGAGNLIAPTDNTYDIGASGATRPRNVYIGSGLTVGGTSILSHTQLTAASQLYWTGRALIQSPSDGIVQLSNNAATDFSRLQFGGTTSSFPALKRSSTTLAVRLADDSADAPISASNGTFSGTVAVGGFTVTTLPAGVLGKTAHVTDGDAALAWGATVVNSGGGATKYLVWYNGTAWTVVGK